MGTALFALLLTFERTLLTSPAAWSDCELRPPAHVATAAAAARSTGTSASLEAGLPDVAVRTTDARIDYAPAALTQENPGAVR